MSNDAYSVTPERLRNLRSWNIGLSFLHAVQAVALLLLAGDFAIVITSNFPVGPPGTRLETPDSLFDLPVGPAVAVFLITATAKRDLYEADLARGINRFRWIEYSVSATIMVVLIGAYSGITDITAVVAIIGANVAMILFGWLQEKMNPPGRTSTTMMPFWFGTIAGLAPWIAVWINFVGADTVPNFVFVLIVVEQVLFFTFALNQWLQYRGVGRWRDYLYGEKVYLVLSLVAKSYLAWQIYGGSLAD
jgi:hypothetical protein